MGGFGHVYLYQHLVSSFPCRDSKTETLDDDDDYLYVRTGVGREDGCKTLPPGAEFQEQGTLEPRDSDHEEVSVTHRQPEETRLLIYLVSFLLPCQTFSVCLAPF